MQQLRPDVAKYINKKNFLNDTSKLIYKPETDSQRKETYGYQRGRREGIDRV